MNKKEMIQYLLKALRAVQVRSNGEWDHPSLKGYLPSSSADDDMVDIAEDALSKAEINGYYYEL